MTPTPNVSLTRSLGAFDVTMLVMGGIVGAGIFMNPAHNHRRTGGVVGAAQ